MYSNINIDHFQLQDYNSKLLFSFIHASVSPSNSDRIECLILYFTHSEIPTFLPLCPKLLQNGHPSYLCMLVNLHESVQISSPPRSFPQDFWLEVIFTMSKLSQHIISTFFMALSLSILDYNYLCIIKFKFIEKKDLLKHFLCISQHLAQHVCLKNLLNE